ncbi:SLATT domain-containing protein [Kluyvera cryocrescens]|uniref:SLATT domain-containing protein n=1 Tax=Kluyvera cryocrescens TaxID=580 RepID=UPI00248A9C21|nr:SLATT domain-containing protein [Kluyvera cryocrescens]
MNQKLIQTVVSECYRIEEDALYSSKSHYNVSDRWDKLNMWFGVPLAILTALSGIAAIKSTPDAVVIFSIMATILSALNTSLNPSKRSALHKSSANEYNKLKNDVRIFRELLISDFEFTDKVLVDKLTNYSDRRNQLNASSPNIPRWAYEKTQNDVNDGFTQYKIDKDEK